ncbi:GNAT family N-acetyltransferase [Burkholderia glumae]|uniref:GNAT family N-acetyltransferase n=1 Tax=Burkholderia glumae TaxID=337 RepID=UPI001463EBDE|nr:GNAT family N-acetyltransferase [Burkholderia glumae]QJP70636.1 GNAT family N-acetyltransferase [Burkholderia glumae]
MPHIDVQPIAAPYDAALADTIAAIQTLSWQHAYAGLLPADYLIHRALAERGATWRARLLEGAEAPLEISLARGDGVPVGFSCLMPEREPEYGVYLDNLHVLPAFQGYGLGKRLLASCAARLAEVWPGRPLFLYVLDGNTMAREFYQRIGGKESAPFNHTLTGANVVLPVRRVTWTEVPALMARLAPRRT